MIKDLIPFVMKFDPSCVQIVLMEDEVVLDPLGITDPSKRSNWKRTFRRGYLHKLSGWIYDGGSHIGYYMHIIVRQHNARYPLFDVHPYVMDKFGAWKPATNPGLTLRDLDGGWYAFDADYVSSPLTIPKNYDLVVQYPAEKEIEEVGDTTALAAYGSPITLHYAVYCYEIVDFDRFIAAVAKSLSSLGLGGR